MKKLTHLESLRGFASVYVAVGHWILSSKTAPASLNALFRFGQEAVIIFFILSGFVIFLSYVKSNEHSLRKYFIRRARRIYFPFFCALIISIVVANHVFSVKQLIGNILMLQDFSTGKPGIAVSSFLGNVPLWSLSYEWTFYLLFPFLFPILQNNKDRVHYIGIFSLINLIIYILFPNHIFLVLSYFFIWWSGLELGEYFLGTRNKAHAKNLVLHYALILITLGIICLMSYRANKHISIGIYPYLIFRHFAFAFSCILLTVFATKFTIRLVDIFKPFAKIAPISYGIYIIHYPILVQLSLNLNPVLEAVIKLAAVLGLAYLIEIVLQPRINKLIN